MDESYLIQDKRIPEDFKSKTFGGYKKTDVYNALYKSIENNRIENACHWVTELIVSGYVVDLWEKLIIYACKIIHINNPQLPHFLYRNDIKMYSHITKYLKKDYIHLRNNLSVRNTLFDVVSTLTTSSKTKRFDKNKRFNDEENFNYKNIKNRLIAPHNFLPDNFIQFNEPEELGVILNEFVFNLKNDKSGYERCVFWIQWLFKWDKLHAKKLGKCDIQPRNVEVDNKYKTNIVWLIWCAIFHEYKDREVTIKRQINSLYKLYCHNFTNQKRNTRLPIIHNTIALLTHTIDASTPVRNNIEVFIQSQCNLNMMFKAKKINEKHHESALAKMKKEKQTSNIHRMKNTKKSSKEIELSIENDKCNDKLNVLNKLGWIS